MDEWLLTGIRWPPLIWSLGPQLSCYNRVGGSQKSLKLLRIYCQVVNFSPQVSHIWGDSLMLVWGRSVSQLDFLVPRQAVKLDVVDSKENRNVSGSVSTIREPVTITADGTVMVHKAGNTVKTIAGRHSISLISALLFYNICAVLML